MPLTDSSSDSVYYEVEGSDRLGWAVFRRKVDGKEKMLLRYEFEHQAILTANHLNQWARNEK
jgi:hypothetical protein